MVYKGTYLNPIDSCGVWTVKVFHLYRGGFRRISYCGDFIKASVRTTKPNNILKKKSKVKGIVIHTRSLLGKIDGSKVNFNINSIVLLKKRMTPKGKDISGPTIYNIKRKRFLSSFPGII